jgi:pyruvate dehydrogenase E2 component (dihydrolipoamide acetyltransferase)
MATIEFKLPDIGEGIAEGEIVKWLVKPGEAVKEHQAIVEVMTDKATVEVPAPAGGTITALKAKEGDTVPVGSVIFVLETAGAASKVAAPHAPAPQAAAAKPAPAPVAKAPAAPARSNGGHAAPTKPAAAAAAGGKTIEFKLPDIGEGIAEGEIVKWLVKAGDVVKEHQAVVEVMTDKATVEVPAPASGTITALHAQEGATVPVGSVIFSLATNAASATAAAAAQYAPVQHPTAAAPARAASPAPAPERVGAAARTSSADSKVLAVPSARRVARDLGIDLASVPASGRGGVVRRADVEAFASSGAPAAPKAAPGSAPARPAAPAVSIPAGEREVRIPFRGVRRKISEAMVRSKFTAPHFTVVEELDVTELVRTREAAKAVGQDRGVKVTYMPFIMKATALALAKYPMLNAHLDEQQQEIVRYGYVNLGIAMDTDNGLIVPVLKDVEQKGILQIAAELNELAERTRLGKVKPEELKGSTFSITNAGNIGGILATPIINFPDVAILGVHRIVKRPGVVESPQGDRIEVRQYMNLSCSVDHRLADGADGARFLVLMKRLLENPGLLAL